ncbi:MAG: hypothetical protein ACPGMT_07065, partial [Candidatus Puniceispirillaceae bacterium]
ALHRDAQAIAQIELNAVDFALGAAHLGDGGADVASIAVEDAIEILGKTARRNDASVEDVVSQAVRRVARSMFGLRPIAQVHIMRVGEEDLRA